MGENEFTENDDWTVDGVTQDAFIGLTHDSITPGRTPFGYSGSFGYNRNRFEEGAGQHPVMDYYQTH